MIDLHCHLLHGVDDGPQSIEEAVKLCEASSGLGVKVAVATPHFNDRYQIASGDVTEAAAALRSALQVAGCEMVVHTGCEISINAIHRLNEESLRRRVLADGNCLLIEPPFVDGPDSIEMMVNDLIVAGFDIMIAHPERSGYLASRPELLERLVTRGAYCSITAASLNGGFGRKVRKEALRLCSAGLVHNVSSDAHDTTSRIPGLRVEGSIQGLPSQAERDELAARLLALD